MKSIFIDCNDQLDAVFARVYRADDPPIVVNTKPVPAAELPRLIDGYEICIDDHSYMPTDMASSYMDVPALKERGVTVHTIKGYGDRAVAEHTIALMFTCARGLARMDRAVRAGTWGPLEGMQLRGKTLGVVGLGGIGSEVVSIARGIGMEVIAWNRTRRDDAPCPVVDLDDLLARADVISLNLSLNDETRGIIDRARIARMKRGVVLINTARGALVDEAALIDALRDGHIAQAGLDVFHVEPLKRDHPLAQMENVTISSHAAFRTLEASMTLMRRAIDIVRTITGAKP
jgi:D-3-phosphoglycerate dehydrogenase